MFTCNGNNTMDTWVIGVDKRMKWAACVPAAAATQIKAYVQQREDVLTYGAVTGMQCCIEGRMKTYFLVGQEKEGQADDFAAYMTARHIMAAAMKVGCKELAVYVDTLTMKLESLLDGLLYQNYEFIHYKKQKKSCTVGSVNLITACLRVKEVNSLCYKYSSMYEGIYAARDFVNMPPNELTPRKFADAISELLQGDTVRVACMNKWAVEKLQMGGIIAVGKGSMNPPQVVTVYYEGDAESKEVLGLVGKGVTYDSGGLSLKSAANQEFMKDDMAGAATVVGVLRALMLLKYPVNIVAVLPLVENIPSGMAYHVDDIITMYNGLTVEVKNTDAEGRLILADALTYAQEKGATKLIDLATLTGACVTALGTVRTGMIGNQQEWMNTFFRIAEKNHEKIWQFPSDAAYDKALQSRVADLKNTGGREAGAITAGMFLKHFVHPSVPWLHLDIAGTAFQETPDETGYYGATGVGVKAILEVLRGGRSEG